VLNGPSFRGKRGSRRDTRVALGRDEAGVTVVEVTVAMGVFAVIIAMVGLGLTRLAGDAGRAAATSDSTTSADLAVQHVDRVLRSAVTVYSPTGEALPCQTQGSPAGGTCLRAYTLNRGVRRCVQFRVEGGSLRTRAWDPTASVSPALTWSVLARGITNSSAQPPFRLATSGSAITVQMVTRNAAVSTTVSPRNTPDGTLCTPPSS
jgi:hypothetical protein